MKNKFINTIANLIVIIISFSQQLEYFTIAVLSISNNYIFINFRNRIQNIYITKNRNNHILRWAKMPFVNNKLLVNPCSNMFKCLYFNTGIYEEATTEFIFNNLEFGDTFVDIGANIGYFTILAASLVGKDGKVYAVEPNLSLLKIMSISVEHNNFEGRTTLIENAIADKDDEFVDFYISNNPYNDGISSLNPWIGHFQSGDLSRENQSTIRTVTFDSLASDYNINSIKIIKLDVEGAEYEVLKGMKSYLNDFKPKYIICETTLNNDVCDLLTSFGYEYKPLELLRPELNWGNILFTYNQPT